MFKCNNEYKDCLRICFMGLRLWVNDWGLSKRINYTSIGRRFENGDFARSVEHSIKIFSDDFRHDTWPYKLCAIAATPALPALVLTTYANLKFYKGDDTLVDDGLYDEISIAPGLVLNR